MKVITQLVRHFWERGALTSQEVEYLLRHGFIRARDVPGFTPSARTAIVTDGEAELTPPEPPGELELAEETLVRRAMLRRGRRPRGPMLSLRELMARLTAEFARRTQDLASVLSLGRRYEPVKSWTEAASALHGVPPAEFNAGLHAGLRDRSVLVGDLWQATDPEPFHRIVGEDEVRGRPARAFLALLVASGPDALGRHMWILQHDEMHALINLRVIHNRLLAALEELFHRDRLLLTHVLSENNDLVQVWSLLVLYNAHRDAPPGWQPQYGTEYGPLEPPPYDVWKQAWTAALYMDRPRVTKFLTLCYADSDYNSPGYGQECRHPMMCPVGWHVPD